MQGKLVMNKLVPALAYLCWLSPALAEEPVVFRNQSLKAAVEAKLWISNPTPLDMLGLTSLNVTAREIDDLTGLEYATNLSSLWIALNQITDLSPLAGLTNLQTLVPNNNQVSDLSPLAGLVNLRELDIHENRLSDISSLSGLTNLYRLDLHDNLISDLSPLSGLTNLERLNLSLNRISDISALSTLTQLSHLYLWSNTVQDVSALSGLTNLTFLELGVNRISDLSPLSGLTGLQDVNLRQNRISDLSPLGALIFLSSLNVEENPLNRDAYGIYLPQIAANNPHLFLSYTPPPQWRLLVSSTAGGSVAKPGEGEFTYDYGETVQLEAQAEPGFLFVGWTGSHPGAQNPVTIPMSQDHQIRAEFLSRSPVLYVDEDAPGDPAPKDVAVGDPGENGTAARPFDSIQEAIEVAGKGVSIMVDRGIYRENLDFLGKSLHLRAVDANDPNRGPCATLEGTGTGAVVSLIGSGRDCTLSGFVITRGGGRLAGAVYCDGSSPTLANCLIVGNRSTDPDGAVLYCHASRAVLTNCTIADNDTGERGAALVLLDSDVTMVNSILWGNTPNEILPLGSSHPVIQYCDIRGDWPEAGNLNSDPLFARRGLWVDPADPNRVLNPKNSQAVWMEGDYHLQSQAGRWDPALRTWVQDDAGSPCLDRGDPASPVGYEPAPNGGRLNLGAYGGTTEASKSDDGTPLDDSL